MGVRTDKLTVAAVDDARNVERSITRLWCLRGSLHLVVAEDVYWLLELMRPRLATANRRAAALPGVTAGERHDNLTWAVTSKALA